ncbi:unnamed protein product [Oikopleura dioica]|uniref:AB hydrolase-1 domain-containing protein n=1 Tax=Oikopleura dioica TaxID=34765 RepID=E4WRV9_OIKDI|nr:unnamed protein product [Oikopleura dioica]CBY39766.1 unnamed protein product [Oikopleura dioica]
MSVQFRQVAYKLPWGAMRGLSVGNPDSKNVYVCLHGWQDNCGLFKPLLSKLPQDNHYIALDLVGHGLSDRLPAGGMYQFNMYPLALTHILESLELAKVNLIGHSLGGGVCGMYTALFPEKVERLILLDSAGMPLIRDDFKGHTKKAFLDTVGYKEKEEFQNTKEELFRRLDVGMKRLGSGLTNEAKELWLERAATKLVNAKYQLNRDRRLALATPGVMSIDQMKDLHTSILDSDVKVLGLMQAKKESNKMDGAEFFKSATGQATKEFFKKLAAKEENGLSFLEGNHHFFVNDPDVAAEHICDFITR